MGRINWSAAAAEDEAIGGQDMARAGLQRDAAHADLLILGSGAAAFAAATRARELGKTAVMIEGRTLGGTCVNRGCLPSKTLIAAAKLVYDAAHPRFSGLTPASLRPDFPALIAQKDTLIQQYRDQHYASTLEDGREFSGPSPIQVIYGRATLVDPHTAVVTAPDGSVRRFSGGQMLVATGSAPAIPDISGLAETPHLTSDLLTSHEAQELTELPPSLVILGGGYIALELGQLFARLGSDVTILEPARRILPRYEPEIAQRLTEILREEGLRIVPGTRIEQVAGDTRQVSVTARVRGRSLAFDAAKLLVAIGRSPNTRDLGLEQIGVRLDPRTGAVAVDAELRTSMPHIWAAGDVIGHETNSQMATPVAAHDGALAASNALASPPRIVNHAIIPRAIFTDPPVGVVGLTDAEASGGGIACECNSIPMSVVPRAGAVHDTRGVVKLVLERGTRRVVGVSMLGAEAAEVVQIAAMGMRYGMTADDLIDQLFVYPTMAEALRIAAISFTKDVRTLSCCAS
jgi:mercuric reductase